MGCPPHSRREEQTMSYTIYSNGDRLAAITNVPGYDLENPMDYWFDGLADGTAVWAQVSEGFNREYRTFSGYRNTVPNDDGLEGMREVIAQQPDFNGDADEMTDEDVRRYGRKHFHVVNISYGEHGLCWYGAYASHDWDSGTCGMFVTRSDMGQFAGDDGEIRFEKDCENLCEYLTSWANGNEWGNAVWLPDNGAWEDCWGFYMEEDAVADAMPGDGWEYICETDELPDEDEVMELLLDNFPSRWERVTEVEHVPERVTVVPAHDVEREVIRRKVA